jgi:hypothetical protein
VITAGRFWVFTEAQLKAWLDGHALPLDFEDLERSWSF